ncbi:MAG: hypothetical protein LWX83_12560 [Anaerolineae bacterium]|nr:hypothetical protein [Anaerolineae bacterium]
MNTNNPENEKNVVSEDIPTITTRLNGVLWTLFAASIGIFMAALILPVWLPGLMASISGTEPKVYWFLSRALAISAFIILWLSMAWGLLLSGRLAQLWPGVPAANDLHQFTSWLGLSLGLLHGLLLMADRYIHFTLFQVLVPFSTNNYRPLWVGMGQISFYLWLLIILSFYVRKRTGPKIWRLIHYTSFITFIMVLIHGILSGSDSSVFWAQAVYWFSAISLFFLTVFRIIYTHTQKQQRSVAAPLSNHRV